MSAVNMSVLQGSRSVREVITLTKQVMGPGFAAARLNAGQLRFDPYLAVDHFWMSQPTFPPHPHAGFCAVTYLFDDSPGSFLNRDSNGDKTILRPGSVNWTTAASGVVHEEVPLEPGVTGHGLQVFANLDMASKSAEPSVSHLEPEQIPTYETPGGGRVKVLAGSSGSVFSPIKQLTPMTLLDVKLPGGASFRHELPAEHNATVLVLSGSAVFGPGQPQQQQRLQAENAADFEGDGNAVACVADAASAQQINDSKAESGIHFVLFSGKPLNQPVVWRGPFSGVSEEQVMGWMRDYQAGKMGRLEPFFK